MSASLDGSGLLLDAETGLDKSGSAKRLRARQYHQPNTIQLPPENTGPLWYRGSIEQGLLESPVRNALRHSTLLSMATDGNVSDPGHAFKVVLLEHPAILGHFLCPYTFGGGV